MGGVVSHIVPKGSVPHLPKYAMTAGIPYKVLQTRREFGRSRSLIQCPFCQTQFWAYWWSLCGSGKRCEEPKCGALHVSSGLAYPTHKVLALGVPKS